MKQELFGHQKQRFSIRKYSFGAASVLLGSMLIFGHKVAMADEVSHCCCGCQPKNQVVAETSPTTPVDQSLEKTGSGGEISISEEATQANEGNEVNSELLVDNALTSSENITTGQLTPEKEPAPVVNNATVMADVKIVEAQASEDKIEVQPVVPTLAPQGSYTFTENTDVKNEAKVSAPVEFYYPKGDKVNYDKVLVNDGHQWLSYISYNGMRRYADLGKVETKPETKTTAQDTSKIEIKSVVKETVKLNIPEKGTYHFDKAADVRNEASMGAPVQFNFDKGESVNYDKVLTNDNHNWISYISYSGIRRYVDLGQIVTKEVVKNDSSTQVKETGKPVSETKEITVSGHMQIENKSNKGFDVIINDVKSSEKISAVRLPIWSDKGGQDDLIWYSAEKQLDGSYKTRVDIKQHKNDFDDYHIHLYYTLLDGTQKFVAKEKVTVEMPQEDVVTGNLTVEHMTTEGFDVVISNVGISQGIKEVLVPIWSTSAGQDDIQWYQAVKQTQGNYKVSVKVSNHKNNSGEYNIHLYYRQNDGQLKFVSQTTADVKATDSIATREVTYNGSYYSIQGKYDEIIIANKKYPLASTYNPGEQPEAREAFIRLRNDMINQGFNVGKTYSGFRSYETQRSLYQTYANSDGHAAADRYSARAGHSEHQTGLAYDFTDKSGRLLEDKAAADWLSHNAHKYGFVIRYLPGKEAVTGYMDEPWHVRYIGKEAEEIYASRKTLEEYYGFDGGDYEKSATTLQPSPTSIAPKGVYTFTKRSSIKAEPKMSSLELAYYDAGETVNYDSVLTSKGRRWISYISYSGNRRYIAIS
ncbi:LD-carboxypeptidase LdcB/DacB [Streptococcus sp. S784/96/1]|uniref:LD-carboxypeptidase LdcB/DacB n=1 Tax=Streptococcus sp. S784/96/1 TaxID=2653499 RepID=UPI00138689C2|nr:LD-carboxypeptidase LdcB/DacB [Streptococcus sp. S784/96/1]